MLLIFFFPLCSFHSTIRFIQSVRIIFFSLFYSIQLKLIEIFMWIHIQCAHITIDTFQNKLISLSRDSFATIVIVRFAFSSAKDPLSHRIFAVCATTAVAIKMLYEIWLFFSVAQCVHRTRFDASAHTCFCFSLFYSFLWTAQLSRSSEFQS